MKELINKIFSENGYLADLLPGYKFRASQLEMAQQVWDSFNSNTNIFIEAPTGVGKSLAYLVPSVLFAVSNAKKVVISTETKALQYQIVNKDIPLLTKVFNKIDISFRSETAFGLSNYICKNRVKAFRTKDSYIKAHFEKLRLNLIKLELGTFEELENIVDKIETHLFKGDVCRDGDLCVGQRCPFFKKCFFYKMKQSLLSADIIIVNNYLFFAHITSGFTVLPEIMYAVFDEAHNFEKVATKAFSIEFSKESIEKLFRYIYDIKQKKGIIPLRKIPKDKKQVFINSHKKLLNAFIELIDSIGKYYDDHVKSKEYNGFYKQYIILEKLSVKEGKKLFKEEEQYIMNLQSLLSDITTAEEEKAINGACEKIHSLILEVKFFLDRSRDDYVYWIVKRESNLLYDYVSTAAPVFVSSQLEKEMYPHFLSMVFTSATLTADGNFDLIKQLTGLGQASGLQLDTPFQHQQNVIEFFPKLPSIKSENFVKIASDLIVSLINLTNGNTFVLFPSYSLMNSVYNKIKKRLRHRLSIQGKRKSKSAMLKDFKKGDAVLFGTTTFWQGIDIPGDALKGVIIVKLPFAVPDDPIVKARSELYERNKRNFFMEYMLPDMIMMLRQGYGRLIRTETDYGFVAILDSRILYAGYSSKIRRSLPGRKTTDFQSVQDFIHSR